MVPRLAPLVSRVSLRDGIRSPAYAGELQAHVAFGWRAISPTRDIPGALPSHREFVAGLRKFGVMPTTWAGGHGTGAAPIKPLIEVLEKADKR
jgi:hypothetical protein